MMSDNNSDCFSSLFGDDDKLGLLEREQLKRNRQRVDAGEPRNSYSSIPNFSSRSSLMSSGLYGAIFSQQSQNFGGLFPANYAPAKMLNELLGRQVKQAQDASNPNNNDGMLNQMESASNNNIVKMDFDGSGGNAQTGASSDGAQSPPTSANDLAHHMLRNILQGKKDLMALDQELRQAGAQDRHSPDSNQNTILNKNSSMLNNNNLINNNNNYQDVTKSDNVNGLSDNDQMSDLTNNNSAKMSSSEKDGVAKQMPNGENSEMNGSSDSKKNEKSEIIDDDILMNSLGDGSNSMPSPGSVNNVKMKEELMDGDLDKELCRSPSPSPSASNKSDQGAVMDLKRARVENIVSTIHSSPALGSQTSIQQPQVNGCKKRKLYHPQQHDNSAVERYAAGLSMGLNLHNLMLNEEDEEEEMEPHIHQKRTEKNVLKSQLRSMQEQLAEMQQKYVQLCNRMEQHSETTEDVDDATSDLVDDDLMRESMSEKRSPSMGSVQQQRTPSASPVKDMPVKPSQVSHAQTMLNQMMSKMMTAKLHHPSMPFNGTHPLLQHMQQQQQNTEHVQHPAFNNAAAMYLSQKLLMEQEARLAKEVEDRNQHQQHQLQMQQQQQQIQKQQEKVQQEMMAREQQAQSMHQMHQQNSVNHQTQSNIPPMKTSPQQQASVGKPTNVPSDLNDRLSMMRVNAMQSANSIGPVSGSDLEGLADILKSEINSSLSSLVDSIVTRFVHQKRMMGKQTEAAAQAAAELNKDLMMASQILDRKSPRTKSSGNDRVPSSNSAGNGGNAISQSGNGSNNSTTNSSNNNTNNNHHMAPSNAMTPIQHHLAHQSMLNQQMTSNGNNNNNVNANNNPSSNGQQQAMSRGPPSFPPLGQHMATGPPPQPMVSNGLSDPNSLNSLTQMQSQMNPMNLPSHVRPSPTASMFQGPPKQPGPSQINSVAAAALYNSISAMNGGVSNNNPFCMPEPPREATNEQNEALSLVVTPKKKRHKVTDTRITPRTVSRILAQDALAAAQQNHLENQRQEQQNQQNQNQVQQQQQSNGQNGNGSNMQNGPMGNKAFGSNGPLNMPSSIPNDQSSPRGNYHHSGPPSMLPVSLPTSVAIPNPSLHESQVFSPYSPFFNPHGPHGPQSTSLHHMHMSSSPPGIGALMDPRDSPPLPHPPTMLHPALLAAAHHGASPDYGHIRAAMDANDRNSDCNSADISYDGMQPTMSFSNAFLKQLK